MLRLNECRGNAEMNRAENSLIYLIFSSIYITLFHINITTYASTLPNILF